jgi:hypothetical protein
MKYRKKPVVIEAFQMTKETRMDNKDWPNWLNQAWSKETGTEGALERVNPSDELPDMLEIITLEGTHLVSWGDFIIQGVNGEIYPCKPDIFEKTYDKVEE